MAQLFRYFQGDPVMTSSPTEVRMWVEELDYSFLSYGEIFEKAEINGERLLNITRKELNELGIISTDHQDILLQAVARIRKKGKIEEQAMHREDQNIKKMPTRFGKESEQLEYAIDRVLVTISERRLARSLHGTIEQPPHSILTATLELVNIVNMILNILERPPFDCMSEFSSLKNHLINHITLLKHFSEQSDLNHENESDIIDMCKGVTKMCHYIISLPPDLPKPERSRPALGEDRPPRVQVNPRIQTHINHKPITTEPEAKTSSLKRKADYTLFFQDLSMPVTTNTFSYGPPVQYPSVPNQRVSESYSSSQRVEFPSGEGAFTLECDKGYKSEPEIQDTEAFETLGGSFYYKTLQDLTIIESDTPLMDSGSEKCVIDSDSDRGVVSDFELEEQCKDSASVMWGLDSDSEKSPRDSDFRKHSLKEETYQLDSGSLEDLTKTEEHLLRIEQCQMESGSLEHWMPSGSEKSLEDYNSEIFSDSDNERKKEEKFQMASASIQRLMESEEIKMENENLWMIPDSESYSVDSDTEKGRASISKVHLTQGDETEKLRTKRYMIDSDSESSETDSDSVRCELASAAMKYFMDKSIQSSASNWFPKDSWSESRRVNSDSESPMMSSDSMKYMKKAETCKSTCNLERFNVAHKSESLQDWLDAKIKQLDSDNSGYWDSSGKYQFRSIAPQASFEKCQGDLQTFQSITEKNEVSSSSGKHQTEFGNGRDQNEPESKRHLIKTENVLDNEGFQMDKERERHLVESDHRDSENETHLLEAHRLGARRKENRPPGFWRPIILHPKFAQEKKTEQQKSVQQKDNKVSRIQQTRYMSEDKNVRFKEASSSLSDKQLSQEALKKKHSYTFSPDSHTFTDEKHHSKTRCKVSAYKRHCKEYRYAHSCESLKDQISPIPLSCTSNVSSFVGSPTSKSPKSVTRKKTRRRITYSVDEETQKCTRCFMEISNSSFHKCTTNSDDSDSDTSLHGQISSYSKYSLHSKTIRHFKTSRNRPLSQSLDTQHPVVSSCSLHREDSKYSVDPTSYLHCESCSALQNLGGSSVTQPISKNTKKIIGQHSTHGHMSAPVRLSQSESKFKLTVQPQNNDASDDSDIAFISAKNIKAEANVEDKNYKDETDHEDETNTEDETDGDDETDTEDEDDTKDKKDPKDKSDPDGNGPKDSNSENNPDRNNGSHSSGSSGPMGGPDSNNDGDSKSVTDYKNESEPTVDSATNSDVNLQYNTDKICTNNFDSASDLTEYSNHHNNTDLKSSINPASVNKTRTVLDYISGSNNKDTGPRNTIMQGSIDYVKNIRLLSNSHQNNVIKNESVPNSNLSPPNSYGLPKYLDSNSNIKPSNATNSIANPNYGTKPTSTDIYRYTAVLNYYLDVNDVTGFIYEVRSSFAVNSNYFDRKKYAARPSFALSTINAIDTSNVTNCPGAISSLFTVDKNYATDTKHFPRFSHFRSFNVIINPISSNISLPATESEINSIISVLKIIYGNISNFVAGTNYPHFLITSEFYEPLELGRAYKIFENQNIGAPFHDSAGYMDSEYATGSMAALDAKESGFLKDFPRIQNTIGIKDSSSPFKVHSNQNITPPSCSVIVEAELPNIVKFAISSGAVNQLFKLSDNYGGGSRAERGSLEVPMREITRRSSQVPVWRSTEAPIWGPEGGKPVGIERGYAVNPAKDLAVSPEEGLTVIPARGRSVSPARGYYERCDRERAVSLARGYTEIQARPKTPSHFSMHDVSSAQEIPLQAARRPPMRHEEKFLLGAAVGLTVKPAEGYDEETSKSARPYTQTISDDDEEEENENGSSIIMNIINCFMKAKAQNWIDWSWFKRLLPAFFSEEDRNSWSKNLFCAISCTELGHGTCEGWLWHKRASRGISLFSWKKYWFILKHSTLYWFSHLNDTKADGFIYLPEFRIDLAPHCRRNHAFQATHARIKDFYFAGTCLDEMNYWVCQTIQLAFGSSFGDTAANAEYRIASASTYAKCLVALKRNFPVIWCNYCQEATTIVSVNPNFEYRRTQNISDEFIYFRPINSENQEKARKQKQQNPTLASQQPTPEGIHQRDLGRMNQVVLATTPPLTQELESAALVKPKTSGLLRIEKIPVKSAWVPEFQRLEVTGIASPEERGKGTAILVAGVPGKEELDDTEIPTLHFTGFVHLEALLNKSSPSSENSRPGTPGNLWMESPENAESPGSDDMEVARSMYPFRERSIFRRSWAELLEAPLNSEGLHILQTFHNEENIDTGGNKLTSQEESQGISHPKDQYFQALQGPFPLLPDHPKLQRQRSQSLPRYNEIRGQIKTPEFNVNAEETLFFPHDHNLLTEENIKKRHNMEGAWQRAIPSHSGEHLPIMPRSDNSAVQGSIGIPEDNSARPRGNMRILQSNVNTIPMVNVGISIDNPQVLGGNTGVLRSSGFGVYMGNSGRRIVSSPLTELSKIGEHQL